MEKQSIEPKPDSWSVNGTFYVSTEKWVDGTEVKRSFDAWVAEQESSGLCKISSYNSSFNFYKGSLDQKDKDSGKPVSKRWRYSRLFT